MDYTEVNMCYCRMSVNADITLSATQLRSYIGYRFITDTDFHQHDDVPYRYPLIQYKRIKDDMYIIGISKPIAKLVQDRISGLQYISLKGSKIQIGRAHV